MTRVVALFAVAALADAARPAEPLVTVRVGTLPVIISAPHGGRTPVPDCPVRTGGPAVAKFVTVMDTNTDLLAEKLAAEVGKRMGGTPHLVVARFERKYADANRPPADAYESAAAKPHYDAYHAALKAAKAAVTKKWGRGLLLDLHGQAADPRAIFRGTNDGKTVAHLTDRFGRAALTGPDSVFGRLAKAGYTIIPANDSPDKEDRRYNGGHVVATYGSRDGGGVDAIQLECGAALRSKAALDKTAADLADAVAAFAREYLPRKKKE